MHEGKPTLDLGGAAADNWRPVPPGTKTFAAQVLVGRRLRVPSTHQAGVVRSVFGHPLFALNSLVFADGSKAPVQGACADDKK